MYLVRGMLEGVQRQQLAPDACLRAAHIAPELLVVDNARVTSAQYTALFKNIMNMLNDEMLGLLSQPLRRGAIELLTRSTLGSSDLEAALQRLCQGFSVLQDEVRLELVRQDQLAGLCIHLNSHEPRPHFLREYLLRLTWRLAAWLAGGSLKVQRFDFDFEPDQPVQAHSLVFPAQRSFGHPHSAFWFDAKRLGRNFSRNADSTQSFIAQWPALVIAPKRERESMDARVRAQLMQHLHAHKSWPTLTDMAQALHVSAATLQRQLAADQATWQGLKDALRRDLAISRLASSSTSFEAMAEELGFSSAAAFQRAFKGWTGSPPGAYRARLLHQQPV